ncbi:MAG: lipoxygenase family protein [Polyangiaceae bacterium]
MLPSLPQDDPKQSQRQKELERARDKYQFDYSYKNLANAKEVPLVDKADPRYWAGVGEKTLEVTANKALWKGEEKAQEITERFKRLFDGSDPDKFGKLRSELERATVGDIDGGRPEDPQDYEKMFVRLRTPPIAHAWRSDEMFAWQAVAGYNATMLTRLTERWSQLPVSDEQYSRATGGADSFDKALAEGRCYVSDYRLFDGVPGGVVDGLQKYLDAPIALYAWQPGVGGGRGKLMPIAIQLGQTPGSPIFTPTDGISWRMARTALMGAESNQGGLVVHFGLCHLALESVVLSARRQLAERHPVRQLLEPHFQYTLIANEITKTTLVNPGGIIDRLQSPPLDVSLEVCLKGLSEFRLSESAPPKDFRRRGVDDLEGLPEYPFRDDSMLVWPVMRDWVESYLRLYYRQDQDVSRDTEFAAFVREMGARDGGRLQGLSAVTSVAELVDLVAQIIFRASSYHASINYPLYDFCFAPSGPTSVYGPGPFGGEADTEAALREMYPPEDLAYESVAIYWPLTAKLNRLGEYPAFADPAVAPLLQTLQTRLADVDRRIRQADASRPLSYLYYAPSEATQSIHV